MNKSETTLFSARQKNIKLHNATKLPLVAITQDLIRNTLHYVLGMQHNVDKVSCLDDLWMMDQQIYALYFDCDSNCFCQSQAWPGFEKEREREKSKTSIFISDVFIEA